MSQTVGCETQMDCDVESACFFSLRAAHVGYIFSQSSDLTHQYLFSD